MTTLVAAVIAGGCDAIQLREQDLPTEEQRLLLLEIKRLAHGRAAVLVNNDLHLAANCTVGLHLPEAGLSPFEARQRLGPESLIGRSVHSAAAAASDGADYVLAGNVFETASHPSRPGLGLDAFADVATSSLLPVLAIGGVNAGNTAALMAAGAHGVAAIGALSSARSPNEAREQALAIRRLIDVAITF